MIRKIRLDDGKTSWVVIFTSQKKLTAAEECKLSDRIIDVNKFRCKIGKQNVYPRFPLWDWEYPFPPHFTSHAEAIAVNQSIQQKSSELSWRQYLKKRRGRKTSLDDEIKEREEKRKKREKK